jgi:hypothetical protein
MPYFSLTGKIKQPLRSKTAQDRAKPGILVRVRLREAFLETTPPVQGDLFRPSEIALIAEQD